MKKIISSRLKALRTIFGYSQDYIAQKLGIVRQTYSHYENGRRIPDGNFLLNLADLYEIPVGDFMNLLSCEEKPDILRIKKHSDEFPDFFKNFESVKKPDSLNINELELLYYFNATDEKYRWELVEFAKILAQKKE